MVFSMMPKPFANQPGSGMHFHVSLWSGWNPKRPDNAQNVFVPHRSDGSADHERSLSPTGRHFIAGVLAHAGALTALAAPTVNSYKRLRVGDVAVGHQLGAGLRGARARTTAPRAAHAARPLRMARARCQRQPLPGHRRADRRRAGRRRPQARSPARLHRGPVRAVAGAGAANAASRVLPQILGEALDALAADDLICTTLGETLTQQFLSLKRAEIDEYGGTSATGSCGATSQAF